MNKTLVSLVKYSPTSKCGDFNGPFSELSIDEQVNYLRYYFDCYSKEVNFAVDNKSFDDKEVEGLLGKIPFEKFSFRNRKYLNDGNYRLTNLSKFKNIHLFANAEVNKNIILFPNKKTLPYPSVEVELQDEFDKFEFNFTISSKFFMPLRSKVDTMVSARNIEFKSGLDEIIKFGIYSNGTVFARIIKDDKYHHTNIKVGEYCFDKANKFSISFKDKIEVKVNETLSFIEYSNKSLPNTAFFGSGLHGGSKWSIELNKISKDNKKLNLFDNADIDNESGFKPISLPLVFGTFANRHKACEFIKEFEFDSGKKAILYIDEIGPVADIYLNNVLIDKNVGTLSYKKEITKFLNQGKNLLKIIVYPTAPENVVSWHRNKDPYFGSYLDNIYIDQVNNDYIDGVKINTKEISKSIIFESRVVTSSKNAGIELEIFDMNGNKIESNSKFKDGLIITDCKCDPWNFKNPNLYKVVYKLIRNCEIVDEYEVITGFRIIDQNGGTINLNNSPIQLNGALLMQYLPPYEEIPLNHTYAKFEDVIRECLSAKNMNSTCIRMHQLGYGSNDKRIARVCDYLGISLIWITKFNETILDVCAKDKVWSSKEAYQQQMIDVINSPSIFVWEGSNELYLYREDIDLIYKEFVNAIKEIDTSRLICPVSHLYYGNDLYDRKCQYYQDDGTKDEFLEDTTSVKEWNDPLVIRSAHTYDLLLGYGSCWDSLRRQNWSAQSSLLNSQEHGYIISEYAVIGRQCPFIKESKNYFNNDSYEYNDELTNGYKFDDNHWFLSQAYQSLAASFATRKMFLEGADGMMWCSLIGGANDGSYLKPIIDFYYHPKLAFYALRDCFKDNTAFQDDVDIVWGRGHLIKPVIKTSCDNSTHDINVLITTLNDMTVYSYNYENIKFNKPLIHLQSKRFPIDLEEGYYKYYITIN